MEKNSSDFLIQPLKINTNHFKIIFHCIHQYYAILLRGEIFLKNDTVEKNFLFWIPQNQKIHEFIWNA